MLNVNLKNEKIKREYFTFLKEAEGCCSDTIDKMESAIYLYEDFASHKDFSSFNKEEAIEYKNWLKKREYRGKPISVTTYHAYLRHLRKFFTWLYGQEGYRSKLKPDSVMYLKILSKEEKIATQRIPKKYPSLEDVIKVVNSIKTKTEIDLRDRALISFTAVTGMRNSAVMTLRIGCVDTKTFIISQDPKWGVQTKFSNFITSILLKVDEELVQYVLDWIKHLKTRNFSSQDPLFPRNKVKQDSNNLSFETSDSVEPVFWKSTGRIREIFKKRFEDAELPYYHPHSFRHMLTEVALRHCKNAFEMKAVSQHLGHENIATTIGSYANCEPQKLAEILTNIDFTGKSTSKESGKLEEIRKILDD